MVQNQDFQYKRKDSNVKYSRCVMCKEVKTLKGLGWRTTNDEGYKCNWPPAPNGTDRGRLTCCQLHLRVYFMCLCCV